ncbi:hypothetical protein D3C84_1207210 [compost metagenome]
MALTSSLKLSSSQVPDRVARWVPMVLPLSAVLSESISVFSILKSLFFGAMNCSLLE